jgi:hypothetical protein
MNSFSKLQLEYRNNLILQKVNKDVVTTHHRLSIKKIANHQLKFSFQGFFNCLRKFRNQMYSMVGVAQSAEHLTVDKTPMLERERL